MKSTFSKPSIVSLLIFSAVFSVNSLKAQRSTSMPNEIYLSDVAAKPIYLKTEYEIQGSPFFPEEYIKTSLLLKSGRMFSGINSRMILYDNSLVVLTDDGIEQRLTGSISRVIYDLVITDNKPRKVIFQKGFPAIDKHDSTTYYEVLDSGKLMLLKHYKVTYSDKRGYGEASYTRVFEKKITYYILQSGNIIRQLGKGEEEFLSILPGKKVELEKYIDDKNIKCKKEEEWIELVSYYNSLEN